MSSKPITHPYEILPRVKASTGLELLAGIRVVDLSTSVAGPYGSQLLADLGANVLKVEKPRQGDDARHWGPPFLHGESPWFLSVNRNKHSMTLDINHPQGYAVLERLLEEADVLILNLVNRSQLKLKLDYPRLHERYPRLIHASLTGFGLKGERADLPCYDLIAEGYSGVMDLTGERESPPQKVGTPAADLLAGQDLAMAILAALVSRSHTGQGRQIDVSMHATMTRFMAPRLLSYLSSNELPTRSGGTDSVIAIYQVFDTADEKLALGLGNDAIWKRFWNAVGAPEYGVNPAYASNADRREHRAEIVDRIASILRHKNRDEWIALLAEARVPCGPVNRLDQVATDPDLLEKRFFYTVQTAKGPVPQVGLGIGFDDGQSVFRKPPPSLGEDTRTVLEDWLGMQGDEIERLEKDGVI